MAFSIMELNLSSALFPFPPTSHELQYISVTSGFTRLSMKTKCHVCRGLISSYVNFHYNRTMWSTKLHVKVCRWGGGKEKEPSPLVFSRFKNYFNVVITPSNLWHAEKNINCNQFFSSYLTPSVTSSL